MRVALDACPSPCLSPSHVPSPLSLSPLVPIDFVLAVENTKTIQGLQYFWRILDANHCGYINTFTINYFLREIVHRMSDSGISHVKLNDVIDEIFDMINPKDPYKITLEDLIRCNVGDTIVVMLTDTNGFWLHDNRETLIASEPEEGEGES